MNRRISLVALTFFLSINYCYSEGQTGMGSFIAIVTLLPVLLVWIIISGIIAFALEKKENTDITKGQVFLIVGIGALLFWLMGLFRMNII